MKWWLGGGLTFVAFRLDFCCIQESRWKDEGAKILGSESMTCKFFWNGCDLGYARVGVIMMSERWISQMIEVRRVSERIIVLRVAIGKLVMNIISAYAPQVDLHMEEKEDFWVRMIETVSSIGPGEKVLIGGDLKMGMLELNHLVMKMCMADLVSETEMWKEK